MASGQETGRLNQRMRTRKDLLAAAGRLLKQGKTPGMDEVAAEAMVSRATVYRYFPSIEALLVEAPIDGAVPDPVQMFEGDRTKDPVARMEKAQSVLHEVTYRNEAQLRVMLAASLECTTKGARPAGIPLRQNRRSGLIHAALEPAREEFTDEAYEKLCPALALYFGIESLVVFSDVLDIHERRAREIKSWAVKALIRAAKEESGKRK